MIVDTGAWYAIADRSDPHHHAALTFWETLRDTRTTILTLDAIDLESAWHIVQAYPDQAFSFVDCTTFAVMQRMGIDEAFAFDSHFLIYRFGSQRQRAFRRLPN